jgi:hypothetical protein
MAIVSRATIHDAMTGDWATTDVVRFGVAKKVEDKP